MVADLSPEAQTYEEVGIAVAVEEYVPLAAREHFQAEVPAKRGRREVRCGGPEG